MKYIKNIGRDGLDLLYEALKNYDNSGIRKMSFGNEDEFDDELSRLGLFNTYLMIINKAVNKCHNEAIKIIIEEWKRAIQKNIYDVYNPEKYVRTKSLKSDKAFSVGKKYSNIYKSYLQDENDHVHQNLFKNNRIGLSYSYTVTHVTKPHEIVDYVNSKGKRIRFTSKAHKHGVKSLLAIVENPFYKNNNGVWDSWYDSWYYDRSNSKFNRRRESTVSAVVNNRTMNKIVRVYKEALRKAGFKVN